MNDPIMSERAQPFLVEILEDLALSNSLSVDKLYDDVGLKGANDVTLNDIERALTWVIEESGVPELPLLICDRVGFNQLGIFGPLIASCETVRDAIQLFHSFKSLLHPLFDLELIETNDSVEVVYAVSREKELPIYYAEIVLGSFPVWFKRLTGMDLESDRVKFRHSKPAHASAYEDYFKAEILYDQPYVSMVVSKSVMGLPCLSASPKYHLNVLEKAKDQVEVTQAISMLVADKFKQNLPEQVAFSEMAKLLNYSERSLQRRLMDEGTNYKKLKQELLKEEAIHLLETTQLTIEQIAYRLGYEQRSSFAAAFQRWTGVSPGGWRTR